MWGFKSKINHIRFAKIKEILGKALPLVIVALVAGEFFTDTLTPRGYSDWVLYVVPIVLTGWMRKPWTRAVAGAASILTILGFFLSPPTGTTSHAFGIGIVNRTLGIITFWVAAILVILRRNALERLQQTHHELEIATEKSLEAEKLKTQLFADTSHELRTPLALVKSYIDLVLRKKSRNAISPYSALKRIDVIIKNMAQIITDITLLTKSEPHFQRSLTFEVVSINKLLEEAAKKLALLARNKHIKIIKRFSKKYTVYRGDKEKLERLFINLLANAIQYGKEGGWIAITLSQDTQGIIIEIKDNGIGIPEEDVPHIFRRFYIVEKTRNRNRGGVGLGLAICKWIVESHGGTIEAASIHGAGSIFTIKLPYSPR